MTRGVDADLAVAGLPPLPRTVWLAIDLDRLVANLRAIRAALPAGVRIEPVVKADGYGHGAVPVADALESAGADAVSVATFDEALQLRSAGVGLPILVLFPAPPSVAVQAADNGITLTLGDRTLLDRTLRAWRDENDDRDSRPPRGRAILRVQVEVETGLGRGGMPTAALPAVLRDIRSASRVELVGLWSHLGSPGDSRRTVLQNRRFAAARELLLMDGEGGGGVAAHLAASGGFLADVAPSFDAVRPGLSIYGVLPDDLPVAPQRTLLATALQPVMSLHARPVRVADLEAGTGISYGDGFVTKRPSRIATLPLGYADGYGRSRTNRTAALVRGHRAPVVGAIAMDAVMVDVTDIPGAPVTVDDEFVLMGAQGSDAISALELARSGTTISWEVLATMARRLPRVYYAAATAVGVRTLTDDVGPWRKQRT